MCFSTQYCLKRNTRAAATTAGEQGEAATTAPAKEGGKRENKAAGAHAAACVLVLTAEAGISFGCSEHQEQMQQQQSRSPLPHGIAQLTEAAQARPRGGQKRHDLGTTWP